jgi:hypothetical protein
MRPLLIARRAASPIAISVGGHNAPELAGVDQGLRLVDDEGGAGRSGDADGERGRLRRRRPRH